MARVDKYLVCMYADELDFYYEKVKGYPWEAIPKGKRQEIRRKAIENGYVPIERDKRGIDIR